MTEQTQDENKLIAERRAKLSRIRENCKSNGFPNDFRREFYSDELQKAFGEHEKPALEELGKVVSIAGRILAKRGPFLLLQDMAGRIQSYASKDTQKDNNKHAMLTSYLKSVLNKVIERSKGRLF